MKNLFFIRSTTGFMSWEYFDSKPEAVVFGDVEGYRYFVECLEKAKISSGFVPLRGIDAASNSMRVLLAPALRLKEDGPTLRIIERPIFKKNIRSMELVVCGNADGYDYLIALLTAVPMCDTLDSDDHFHLDDSDDPFLLRRSVSLNVRHPLSKWDENKVGHWHDLIYRRQEAHVPKELDFLFLDPEPYAEPSLKTIKQLLARKGM